MCDWVVEMDGGRLFCVCLLGLARLGRREKGRCTDWSGRKESGGEREVGSDVVSAVGGVGCGLEVLEGLGGVVAWVWA